MKYFKLILFYSILITNFSIYSMGKVSLAEEVAISPSDPVFKFSKVREQRDALGAARFRTIKISPEKALDEINFWSRQMSEHALFLHLGLEKPKLKKEGLRLHKQFETFRNALKRNPKIMKKVLPLTKRLRNYKIRVLKALNAGRWIGWIFPQFARHITLELDYFIDKLNGIQYSDRDEILFWNIINGEHAGFASHLLDPSERELFEKADNIAQKLNKIVKSEEEMMLQISLKSAKDLDQYNKTAKSKLKDIKSIIHPVLLDHVIREGERSIKILDSLKDKTGAIYPKEITSPVPSKVEKKLLKKK